MKKAALKTAGISMEGYKSKPAPEPGTTSPAPTAPSGLVRRPFTGIGLNTMNANVSHELADARQRLEEFDGATLVRALDPTLIRRSRFANRIMDEFATSEFRQLKEEIAHTGGNVQPIKVRSIDKGASPIDGIAAVYEIAFGHRRHQACLELGLNVNAIVDNDLGDLELFEQMDRENRGRKNLSAWEQGRMYQEALNAKLYPSERRLAESLGVNQSNLNRAIKLANLPKEVVLAFASPLDLQVRWQKPLTDALQKDPDGVLARARDIATNRGALSAAQILDNLTARVKVDGEASTISVLNRTLGTIKYDSTGAVTIVLAPGAVSKEGRAGLLECLEAFLNRSKKAQSD